MVKPSKEDEDLEALRWGAGCIGFILQFTIVWPIWYILLFGVLQRTEAPAWHWILYWIYVPVGLISGVIWKVFSVIAKGEEE